MLQAAAAPSLSGAAEIGMVKLKEATISPLREYGFGWHSEVHNEYLSWQVPLPVLTNAGDGLSGQFGVPFGPPVQDLARPGLEGLLRGTEDQVESQIDLNSECGVLAPPSEKEEPYRFQASICEVTDPKDTDYDRTTVDPHRYRVHERTYTLHNPQPVRVRFVLSVPVRPNWWIDSAPKPDVMVPGIWAGDWKRAIFVVHAGPGERVQLHVATRGRLLNNDEYEELPMPMLFPVLAAQHSPDDAGLRVTFDGYTVAVKTMSPTLEGYVLRGEFSGPAGVPAFLLPLHQYAVNWNWQQDFLGLRVVDSARWRIEGHVEYGEVQHVGNRDVVQWALFTDEPGRVPSSLLWRSPRLTRWLMVPFKLSSIAAIPNQ